MGVKIMLGVVFALCDMTETLTESAARQRDNAAHVLLCQYHRCIRLYDEIMIFQQCAPFTAGMTYLPFKYYQQPGMS